MTGASRPSHPPAAHGHRARVVAVCGLALAVAIAVLLFAWMRYEPFHRAGRDADRVFSALTGAAPVHHQKSGNYLGFDVAPTVDAYGPLPAPTTVRAEMARFAAALERAGYRPAPWSAHPRSWCSITGDAFWAPNEPAPSSMVVRCGIDARTGGGCADARLTLQFQVPPEQLHPTRTSTGYFAVSAEEAVDLRVAAATVDATASCHL